MKIIAIILLFTFNISVQAASNISNETFDFDETKKIQKGFAVSDGIELEIDNKYGDISIEPWDKDSIVFEITISATSNDPSDMEEMIEQVQVDFDHSEDYINAFTSWPDSENKFKNAAIDIASIFGKDRKLSVNYLVKVPTYTELDIDNKFGDISIGKLSGDIKIDLSHGSIKLKEVEKIESLKINYGKLRIKQFEKAHIISKASTINIGKGKKLKLSSSASEVEIDEVEFLDVVAKHGNFEIEKVGSLEIMSGWCNFEVEELTENLEADIKYGDLSIENIPTSFKGITINGSYADIELYFNEKIAFHYDVSLINGKRFSLPSEGNTTEQADEFDNIHEYSGQIATIPVSGLLPTVKVKMKSSYLDIRLEDF